MSSSLPPPVKHIHFVWLQGETDLRTRQPMLWGYVQTWAQHFPDWGHTVWDDTMLRELLSRHFDPAVLAAYTLLPKFAMKSDIGRYAALYAYGGMYVDTDMECLRNFEHLLSRTAAPNALFSHDGHILGGPFSNNCWFYFPYPHGAALATLLKRIPEKVAAIPASAWKHALHGLVFGVTGPTAFREALQDNPPTEYITRATLEPVTANNLHLDADGDAARAQFPDAYAIHHPQGSWMSVNGAFLKWFGRTWGAMRAQMPLVFPICVGFLLLVVLALSIVLIVRKAAPARRAK